ncbi:MAG: hypothetical protein HY856_13330 [Burkholderiales bacterium]|nr:hypothetical protein [Burkholderiales bacterium]
MTPRIWNFCVVVGGLALFSAIFYAFTGLGLWAPTGDGAEGAGRSALLMMLHAIGIAAGISAIVFGKDDQ